ncbi:MAG: glycosyltransferase [Muribaculaceae bacterium]|nr:glycosyltransferase [Muribaculaceae bacterium]
MSSTSCEQDARVVVLIPCYNEAVTVAKVVTDVKHALPTALVVVCDNNSTDDTASIAREAGAQVVTESRQGKGNVLRTLFRNIDADCYIIIDGDDTYSVDQLPHMADMVLSEGVDMVIGDRISTSYLQVNKRRYHNSGNLFLRFLINKMFNSSVPDILSGLRALSPAFVKNFPILSHGFEIETEMTIYALDNNFALRSIPIAYNNRPEGSTSKLNTFSDGFKVIKKAFSLFIHFKPLLFFSILASVLFLAGAIGMIPVFVEYFATGLVPRFPTLIVCGFVILLSLLLLVCGLILEVANTRHKQLMEVLMNKK